MNFKLDESAPKEDVVNVAVYGTLKKGWGNHRLIEDCQQFPNVTLTNLKLYTLGGYPGVKLSDNQDDQVEMEVYSVPSFRVTTRLDRLEGIPFLYRRYYEPTNNVFFYLFNHEVDESARIQKW
jgi:gamma-glutamylcyclotransferase (GGCT)/AIG2-like uncharacterized protein YtfP